MTKREAELEAELAEKRARSSSSTYGDLVKLCPTFAATLESHDWDNFTPSEQRDKALVALAEERALLDGAADLRIVDGIGSADIDEAVANSTACGCSGEDWKLEWRKQFRIALRVAIVAALAAKGVEVAE